jgi:hypothetical protein
MMIAFFFAREFNTELTKDTENEEDRMQKPGFLNSDY